MSSPAGVLRKSIAIGLLLAVTSGLATVYKPKPLVASAAAMPDLERVVPVQFGDWQIDKSIVPLAVAPDVARTLDTIYDKTLSRTYVNRQGQRVMLSLAYGANQSRALQLHKPEVCYVAQGFRVTQLEKAQFEVGDARLPVMKMVAVQGGRIEPIVYWMRIGDDVARGWLEQNKVRLKYGLGGEIPDGLLFRVSNISSDVQGSYQLQQEFVSALLKAVAKDGRSVLIGALRASQ